MIQGLNHLTLSVSDLERSFAFYREILQLKPLCRWGEGAYFLAGDLWLCLFEQSDLTPAKGYTHYSFSVAEQDFPKLVKRLKEHGIQPFKGNKSEGSSYYFHDPDGHQLELHVGDWRSRLASKKQAPWPDAEFYV